MRKYQKCEFILLILDGACELFLIQTFLKNLDHPPWFSKFPNWNWDIFGEKNSPPSPPSFSDIVPTFFYFLVTPPPLAEIGEKVKIGRNTSLAAPGALAHRLQRRTACKIKMAARGPQNGWLGPTLGY